MGYTDWIWKSACSQCGLQVLWSWQRSPFGRSITWTCSKCEQFNSIKKIDRWPNLPQTLYIGYDQKNLLRLYPLPPESSDADWALPYSTRSFVYQASRVLGGCHYRPHQRGTVMGETVFSDHCYEPDVMHYSDSDVPPCHIVAGWTAGADTCPLWEKICSLCQTDSEKQFLRWYFGLARDRNFPALIPQARIGIAERRRPDYVLFVPLTYWTYKWYAIQLDAGHRGTESQDELRDAEISMHGYEVVSLKPGSK